jgi:hypothetical protein
MGNAVFWTLNSAGSWFTAADWSDHKLPGAADDVSLSSASRETISFNGTDTVESLTSTTDALAMQGGTLGITGDASLAGGLNQTGGLMSLGGTANDISGGISISNGAILVGAGKSLTLAGSAVFGGNGGATIGGAGTLTTAGTLTIILGNGANEAVFGGGLVWDNTGLVVDAGIFSAGMTNGIAFTVNNQAQAVFDFTTDTACLMNGAGNGGLASSDFFNAGLLEKTGGTGDTTYYATIVNTGTISVQTGTLDIEDGGTIGGILTGPGVLELAGGGTLHHARAIDTNIEIGGGTVTLSGLTVSGVLADDSVAAQTGALILGGTNAGHLEIAGRYVIGGPNGIGTSGAGGSIDITGTLAKIGAGAVTVRPGVTDDGAILVGAGTLKLAGALSGTGGVTISGGAGLAAGTVGAGIAVSLDPDSVLILDSPGQFAGQIANFIGGTTLDLRGLIVTAATASSAGQLTLEDNGAVIGTLRLANNDSGARFTYQSDKHGGTLLEFATPKAAAPGAAALFGTPASSPLLIAHAGLWAPLPV